MLNINCAKKQSNSHASKIFYGAGQNAQDNITHWIDNGVFPDSFADNDPAKHHTMFTLPGGEEIEILPLLEAIGQYPDYEIYITLMPKNLKEITQYLIKIGIPKERIKYCEPYEFRLGCDLAGRMFLYGNKLETCSIPGYIELGTDLGNNMEENYSRYVEFCDGIIEDWRNGKSGVCDGCPCLRLDIWKNELRPEIDIIEIASKESEDHCNAKCKYCCYTFKPGADSLEKRKKDVIDCLRFFSDKFPGKHFEVFVLGGEPSIAPYRKEVFEIIQENDWTGRVYTNGMVYCEEISEFLRAGRGTVWVTLDSTVPEKYADMKGIDCLSKTMENIRRYAEAAKCKRSLGLKMIILDGEYEDFEEIKGVVDFAAEIDATVILSCDTYAIQRPLSPLALGLTVMFIRYALEKKLCLTIMYDHFKPIDAEFLKKLV